MIKTKYYNFKFSQLLKNKNFSASYTQALSERGFKAGFTILEAIVAIFVLSLTISGVFSSVRQGLSQSNIAKDEVKAFYLAQEGVEIIRNWRDNNQLKLLANQGPDGTTNNWLSGIAEDLSDPCNFFTACVADVYDQSLEPCAGACPFLKQDPVTFLYTYTTGNTTTFKREIRLNFVRDHDVVQDNVADEIEVVVRVSWSKGIINRSFEAKTHLFNWVVTPRN